MGRCSEPCDPGSTLTGRALRALDPGSTPTGRALRALPLAGPLAGLRGLGAALLRVRAHQAGGEDQPVALAAEAERGATR